MKIGYSGINLEPGKIKYQDPRFLSLVAKFNPQKVTPFFAEFVPDDFLSCACILVSRNKALDIFIEDMEKLESRLGNSQDAEEKDVIKKSLHALENETPLCDVVFSEEQAAKLRVLAPLSFKPVLIEDACSDINVLIERILQKAKKAFFYTAGKKEVKAWLVSQDLDIVSCAGKIHSDLARGFIKAEVVNVSDFLTVHNMQEAKTKGFVQLVDREYRVRDGDIIDIRFNV